MAEKNVENEYEKNGCLERIERLKREKNAVIFAHNFERPEVMDIADVTGGSTGLIKAAKESSADIIVVCAVNFMAEAIAMLNPDKKVIVPVKRALCPLARQLTKDEVLEAKRKNPDAKVLLYMNSLTEAKAVADCICTAANAIEIVEKMGGSAPIIFGPDHGLVDYIKKRTEKEIISIPEYGACPVHHKITRKDLIKAKDAHPRAKIVAHPECLPEIQDHADYIGSTGGMIRYCKEADDDEFLIASEVGLIHMLEKEAPNKTFYPVSNNAFCGAMKKHTLENIEEALEQELNEVVVPEETAIDARRPIEMMYELA